MNEPLKILVVDDNRKVVTSLRDVLHEKGYAVSATFDGKTAIAFSNREQFDLVLLDFKLPDMDGLQVQEQLADLIRADYIMITGYGTFESVAEAVHRKKIVGYETKPLDMNRLLSFIKQIADRIRAEEASRENEERFRIAFDNANVGVCLVSIEGRLMKVNPKICEIFGYCRDELEGMNVNDVTHPEYREIRPDVIKRTISGEIGHSAFERKYLHKNGHVIWGQVSTSLVKDAQGRGAYYISHITDITRQKQAEEKLTTALAEKETLLQELFHRTKNNMQVIISLLSLQSAVVQDKKMKELLKDIENKIHAMALVHQKLYHAKDLSRIDLREYIQELTNLLMKSYGIGPDSITLRLDLEKVSIIIDTAIPCGLILNELISNTFKHAFPEGKKGELRITLTKTDQEYIELIIADNGVGVPDGFDCRNQETLGLKTVFMIVECQLNGVVQFDGSKGLSCYIRFRDTLYKERV